MGPFMISRLRLPLTVVALVALVACGGTASSSTAAQGGGDATATPAPAGGDGGEIDDFCLNTDDEVANALDVEVADSVSTPNPGFGGGCLYTDADDNLVHAIAVVPDSGVGQGTLDAARETGETVDGIGDDAVMISAGGPLAILKGEWLISIGAAGPGVPMSTDATAFRAALEELGRSAVDRLP